MAQDRYRHLVSILIYSISFILYNILQALVQARQKLDKENRIVARLENSQVVNDNGKSI